MVFGIGVKELNTVRFASKEFCACLKYEIISTKEYCVLLTIQFELFIIISSFAGAITTRVHIFSIVLKEKLTNLEKDNSV